eukprot:GHVT01028208.1.p2 GENE.GHVT01028208.1~~GHVT01028208.1.p2  ORF type:complete len:165 (+),score=44.42 GHVT01028208.1:231-725(+)
MASLPLRRQTMRRLAVLHRHCGAAHTQSTRELVASYSTASFASHTAIGTSRLHTSTPADNAASSAAAAAAATTRGNAAAASGGAAAASSSAAAAATGASVASGSSGSAVESLEGNGDIIVRRFPEGLTHVRAETVGLWGAPARAPRNPRKGRAEGRKTDRPSLH